MLDFTKVEWEKVLPLFKIDSNYLKKKSGPCPICSTEKRGRHRFRFDNKDGQGTWYCQNCGAGNGFTLIQKFTGRSSYEILRDLEEKIGNHIKVDDGWTPPVAVDEELTPEEVAKNRVALEAARAGAKHLDGNDPVSKYLRMRVPKCDLSVLSRHIRYHPRMKYYEQLDDDSYVLRGVHPVMLAQAVDSKDTPITLHRTYLTMEGKKAPYEKVKKQMAGVRKLKGAAIRLNDVPESRTLGLCEGIETGFAIITGYRNTITVWSMLNCRNMSVADIPRDRFDKVIFFVDHDKLDEKHQYRPGEHFGKIGMEKLKKEGFVVEMRIPEVEETDFCDVWNDICNSNA